MAQTAEWGFRSRDGATIGYSSAMPRGSERSDEELAAAYARGDASAFEELFLRFAPVLRRKFRRQFPHDPAIADDLVQGVFVRIHKHIHTYDPSRPFRPWLYVIAMRLRGDESRLERRRREVLDAEGEPARDVPIPAPPPSDPRAAAVSEALGRLTEHQRELLHLREVDDLSYREIGAHFAISEGAAKLRTFRAYEALRGLLTGKGE